MLELLAAIQSADPLAFPLVAVLALAAGMYPVGIMLGTQCSPCCPAAPKCESCTEGELPETLTVTFSGLPDQEPGPNLCVLTFSAPYGSGAAGHVTAPVGDPDTDKGPITAATVTNKGNGYALLGRVEPTVTASGGSGTGATFTVQTTKSTDANGIPSWSVTGVTVTGTTSGYVEGDQVTFDVAAGDTAESGALATIHTNRAQPTVTASVSGGSNATLGVTLTANGSTPETWSVTGVSVTNGGTGYPSSGAVSFTAGSGDTEELPAAATFFCGRLEPTLSLSVDGTGSGADLSAVLDSTTDGFGRTYWFLDGITIDDGGSGYSVDDPVTVTVTDGDEEIGAGAVVASVDGTGTITAITVNFGGAYYKSDGVIDEVVVDDGGSYYNDDSTISSVSVEYGGVFYREDSSEPPYVATITVGITQTAPSAGTGATLTATVEDDVASADFGKIISVSITNGGDDYLAWELLNTKCCGAYYNGMSVVLKRLNYGSGDPCLYQHRLCGIDNVALKAGSVVLQYLGPATPPTIVLSSEDDGAGSKCDTSFTADNNVTDCSDWSSVSFSSSGEATASVSAGGDYDLFFRNPTGNDSPSCNMCCQGEEAVPQEIEFDVTDNAGFGASGVYIVSLLDGVFSNGKKLDWERFGDFNTTKLGALLFHDPSFPLPEIAHCDDCASNCRIEVGITPGGTDLVWGFGSACLSVPRCNPYGTYTLTRPNSNSTYDIVIGPA